MMIHDPRDGKNYEIQDLKLVEHEIPDKRGRLRKRKCVEYLVIGSFHDWPFWMLYDEFRQANPNTSIPGVSL
jgi:hypothetical protein